MTTNQSALVQGNSTVLSCDVTSRPASEVHIYNVSDGSELDTAHSTNRAEYTWTSVDCLHTGMYRCTAGNGVPGAGSVVQEDIQVEVYCEYGELIS